MTQYINKAAIVAEMERRVQESIDAGGATRGWYLSERIKEDSHILSFIDTLEVKEVNEKSTWSEEDECILDNITVRLKQQGDAQAKVDIDWLKSLKKRMKGE